MRKLLIFLMIAASTVAAGPYDENANAAMDIQAALSEARDNGKMVLLKFGANWWKDCLVLAEQFQEPPLKELIEENFILVKIDIGDDWEKNNDIVLSYGNPIDKGIPTIVVVDKNNNVLTGTLTGQLANARNMGMDETYDFFVKIINDSKKLLNRQD